jgi:hypothetical protein
MTSKDLLNRESGSALEEQLSLTARWQPWEQGLPGQLSYSRTALAKATPESVCGRGYRRRHNRRENPWIRVERCIHFPRWTLRRVHRWRQALYAVRQT